MSNILIERMPFVSCGLGSFTYTIKSTGVYNIGLTTTVLQSSSLAIVVTKNGSPIYTAPAFTPTQEGLQFNFNFLATAADAMVITLSSSNPNDLLLNSIKTTLSIENGI